MLTCAFRIRYFVNATVEEYRKERGVDRVEQQEFIAAVEAKLGWTGNIVHRNKVAKELQEMKFHKKDGCYVLPILEDIIV